MATATHPSESEMDSGSTDNAETERVDSLLGHQGRTDRPSDPQAEQPGDHDADDPDHYDWSLGLPIITAGTLIVLSSVLLSPGIEQIKQHFAEVAGDGQSGGWFSSPDLLSKMMVTTPAVVVMLVAPFGGFLVDRIGRRPILLFGLAVFGIAGAGGGLLSSPWALIASRVGLGIGVTSILLATRTLIGDFFDGSERKTMLGTQIVVLCILSTIGMFAAAYLVGYSWRYPFALHLISLMLLPWAWKQIEEPDIESQSQAEASEQDQGDAKIDWYTVTLIYAAAFTALMIFHLATTQIPEYLGTLGYESPYAVATMITLINIVSIPSALAFQPASDRISHQTMLLLVFAAGGIGFLVAGLTQSIVALTVGLVLFASFYGFRTPAYNAWLLDVAPAKYRGRIMAGLTAACFAGMFFSPLISNPLKSWIGMRGVLLTAAGMQTVFTAAFVYFAFKRNPSKQNERSENRNNQSAITKFAAKTKAAVAS